MRPSSTALVEASTLGILQEPLLAQVRLDGHVAALAVADVVDVVLDLEQQALLGQFLDHRLARFHAVQAGEVLAGVRGHGAVGADDDRERQVVAHGHLVVGRVVRGVTFTQPVPNFGSTSSSAMMGMGLFCSGSRQRAADEMRVARIGRVHRHGLVAEHRLGAGGGDDHEFVGLGLALVVEQRILEVPEVALLLDHLHFLVGERGAGGGVPVHHAFAAVDEALLVELDEDLLHAARVVRVHREALAGPVAGAAELLELLDDDAAVLLLPGPDVFEELLAAEVVAVLHHALLAQRLLHHGLRGDAGVVGAGQPEHFLAVHARLAGEDVLDGVVQHVPHVEHARDVGRRDDDGIGRLGETAGLAMKQFCFSQKSYHFSSTACGS